MAETSLTHTGTHHAHTHTQATAVADAAKKELDEVSTQVLEEVERFKREKLADFRTIVLDYVQLQIDYNNRVSRRQALRSVCVCM